MKIIKELIANYDIVLFMKGTLVMPRCQFSAIAVNILQALEVDFEVFNVFDNEEVYDGIKKFSNWPTIPQLYVKGKFIGGSDIIKALYQNGELHKIVGK